MAVIEEQIMVADNDTLVITDPCYLLKNEDWDTFGNPPYYWSKGQEFLSTLNFGECLIADTGYGDWTNSITNNDTGETLGMFCADAGMVCVVTMSDLTNYGYDKQKVQDYIDRGLITIIPDFTGTIKLHSELGEYNYTLTVIEGTGDFNFSSEHIN